MEANLKTMVYPHDFGVGYLAMVFRALGDGTWRTEASCAHRHRTIEAAQQCAEMMSRRAKRRLTRKEG